MQISNGKSQINFKFINSKIIKLIASFVICLFAYLLILNSAFAQKNTVSVLPQITRLDLAVDKPEAEIIYTNDTSKPLELSLSVENVKELEDRNPVGILDPKESANYKYALASWVYLDKQTLLINPGERQTLKVIIDRVKLSPGGHYGAILAEMKQTDDKREIKLKGILTSLLFVRASTGFEIEEAKISSFSPIRNGLEFPKSFVLRFQNTGNVDLTPYGLIEIKDSGGKLVAKSIINDGSLITLPEAIRRYDIPVTRLQKIILPGKYTVNLTLHYGNSKKEIRSKTTFTTQGSTSTRSIVAVLGGLGALVIATRIVRKRTKGKVT